MNVLFFVTVRFSSSRLPGKCLLEIDGISILQHLVERLRLANFEPIICTSLDPTDDEIVALARVLELNFYRGSLQNKIERWADCASHFGAELVHILDADDPFVDVEEISASIRMAQELDLDLLRTSRRSDSGFASVGMTIKTQFLQNLKNRVKKLRSDNLDVIPWELLLTNKDRVKELPDNYILPHENFNLRLTLDYPEDFQVISKVIQALGNTASRKSIEEFLYDNPKVSAFNASRTSDFLNNKGILLKSNFDLGTGAANAPR